MAQRTNNGMIADIPEMMRFIAYLKQLMDNLRVSMVSAQKSLVTMRETGYQDDTFKNFQAQFDEEIKIINALNERLEVSAKHYQKLFALVQQHLQTQMHGRGRINF